MQHNLGPVLFREECNFKKEIRFGDKVEIDLLLTSATTDFVKWSMEHQVRINDEITAATIRIDAAWMDTVKRKIASPPTLVKEIFQKIPRSTAFRWIER